MESLALLCTLHADGPATLKRLRRAGCDSLEAVEAYDAVELASLLEVPPAVARRLLKEARGLSVRLDDGVLDDSEEAPQICTTPGVAPGIAPQSFLDQGNLDRRDQAILGRVLDHWSDETPTAEEAIEPSRKSVGEPTTGFATGFATGSTAGSTADSTIGPTSELASEIESPEPVAPIGAEAECEPSPLWPEDPGTRTSVPSVEASIEPVTADIQGARLSATDVEGLDEAGIAVLANAGILTLTELVSTDPLSLADMLGLTYANARRMQFIARAAQPTQESAGETQPQSSVALPAVEPEVEDPASSAVSLSFGVQETSAAADQGNDHVDASGADTAREDSGSARKFWEPQTQVARVTQEPPTDQLPVEQPSAEADEPVEDLAAPESPLPTSAGYSTPWAQESDRPLTKPLEVHFPEEPAADEPPAQVLPEPEPEPEPGGEEAAQEQHAQGNLESPVQAASDAPEARSGDRPLTWNFDLTGFDVLGPAGRFPDHPVHPGDEADQGERDPSSTQDQDGVGGPFA